MLCFCGGLGEVASMAFEPNNIGDTLINIGIRIRVVALGVEALAREKDRSEDGQVICALLWQFSEEIAEVSALMNTDHSASSEEQRCPLHPLEQTWAEPPSMSVKCQKQT
jgi:hypothetical protein